MIDARQLLVHIIRPVLHDLGLWSVSAERIVLGTSCQESQMGRYIFKPIVQLGGGPALSIYQIEPDTHDDVHDNFLRYRPPLERKVLAWAIQRPETDLYEELKGNLYYSTAICRVIYYRVKSPLPTYLAAQAQYYKTYFNTEAGAATVEDYMNSWNRFITPDVLL